jgi:putative copper resistance protein D
VASLAAATLSPLNHYGDQLLWANFTGFLVLTMVAAPLMLLGAPVTLFFRVADAGGRRRARKWLASRAVRTVTFPITAWLLFAVVTYVWQFTSLTEAAARNPVARDVQQSTLLVVALTFWAPALCADPGLLRMGYPLRILYVFLEMTHKGLFGGMFLSMSTPFHGWYAANAPAWAPSAMTDQRIAIVVLWIGGNLVFLAVLVGLAIRWIQYEGRVSARIDRRLADWRAAERRRQAALATVFKRP